MQQSINSAFNELFRRYYPSLHAYAISLIGDDEAEDVVEDVFAELWRRQEKIDLGEHIQAYLYRSVYTRSMNVLRHRKKTDQYISISEKINQQRMQYLDLYSPQHYTENEHLRTILDDAINELPDKCREIFRLSYLYNLRNSEIASSMEISVKTVEAHISKALKHLRSRLLPIRKIMP